MSMTSTSTRAFDRSIRGFMLDAARVSRRDPALASFFLRTAWHQRCAAARRHDLRQKGVRVPPIMIVSVNRPCDPYCTGCFVHAHQSPPGLQLSDTELRRVLTEVRDLGVSIVVLAGGEPSTRPEILDIAADLPEMLFMVITNGALLDDQTLDRFERSRNLIPIVILEGLERQTDGRRGNGAYRQALTAMERMKARRIFFGTSIMVTWPNFALTTSRTFVRDLVQRGSRLFFYVDYAPAQAGADNLVPSERQRRAESLSVALLRREFPAVFIASSATEDAFGGCALWTGRRSLDSMLLAGSTQPAPELDRLIA